MGTDKALLKMDGKTLLQRAVGFCQLFCHEILISSDSPEHQLEGVRLIPDEIKNCGPMGGIYSCLRQSGNDWNFVLSVDAAFVEMDFVVFLKSGVNNFEVVVPEHSGKKEPLIALYNKKILPEFESQLESGSYKMRFLLEKVKTNFISSNEWLEKYPKLFYNMNTPEDLILED